MWGTGHIELMGGTMRSWISLGLLIASTMSAYAGAVVPEIDATSGLSAMAVVGSIAVLVYFSRRDLFTVPLWIRGGNALHSAVAS